MDQGPQKFKGINLNWLRIVASISTALSLLAAPALAADPPRVVATIKPIHALAANVMAGTGEPILLLNGSDSPHSFSLRPSQATALAESDLVVRVGPSLETGLTNAVETLAGDARHLLLSELPGIALLKKRAGGMWEVSVDDAHPEEADGDGGDNMHLWLDPLRMKVYVAALADALGELDPSRAGLYQKNAGRVVAELETLDTELARIVAPVKDKPFIVFHDAYRYFEDRYGLTAAGSIALRPDRAPGPKRVNQIRNAIFERNVVCVFAEPQFPAPIIATAIEGTPARRGDLDPLGASLDPGPTVYFELMRQMAHALADCLRGG